MDVISVIRSGATSSSEGVIHLKYQISSLMYKGTGLRCVKTVHFLMCAPWKPPKGFTNTSGFSFWSIVKMWPSLAIISYFQGKTSFQKFSSGGCYARSFLILGAFFGDFARFGGEFWVLTRAKNGSI